MEDYEAYDAPAEEPEFAEAEVDSDIAEIQDGSAEALDQNVDGSLGDALYEQPESAGLSLGHRVGETGENLELDHDWKAWKTHDGSADTHAKMAAKDVVLLGKDAFEISHGDANGLNEAPEHAKSLWENHREMRESRQDANEIRDGWRQQLKQTDAEIATTTEELQKPGESPQRMDELSARLRELNERKEALEGAVEGSRPHPFGRLWGFF